MRISVITIFPAMVREFSKYGLIARAIEDGMLELDAVDLRGHAHDRHRTVDDTPFGGGGGMVLRPEPLFEAVEAVRRPGDRVVLLSPQGTTLTHAKAVELACAPGLLLVCGRYEGVDERFRQKMVDEEVSIGDYVLMGGELPALVLIEALSRMVGGVVGNPDSVAQDSFADGLLDFPHYTRPAEFRGLKVPETLVSGNHAEIARWRRQEAIRRTRQRRPDLLTGARLTDEDRVFISRLNAGGLPEAGLGGNAT